MIEIDISSFSCLSSLHDIQIPESFLTGNLNSLSVGRKFVVPPAISSTVTLQLIHESVNSAIVLTSHIYYEINCFKWALKFDFTVIVA